MHRVIGERDLSETPFSAEQVRDIFRDMVRARRFDERAVALQRRGWMSGYPPFAGQEASQVGAAHAMLDHDWLFPTYRSNAMQIALGVPISDVLLFRRGRAEFYSDHDRQVFPQAVPIATQIPHAAGMGMAIHYQREVLETGADPEGEPDPEMPTPGATDGGRQAEDPAVVCYFGDGATSEGDFHEGLNFAGVFDAPVLFFCENNNWAISLPRSRQTAADTIAQKAHAYGFSGGQVDGNDPLAVREMVASGLASVRDGEPALIESLTYRQGAHTTSDDPSRYRDVEGDLPEWRTADPLERFEEYLRDQDAIDDETVEQFHEEADEELDEAIERVEEIEAEDPVDPDDVFENVYHVPDDRLRRQREWLRSFTEDYDPRELEH
jgi:pyruvate dehydrogenase E1 component alpha subunit